MKELSKQPPSKCRSSHRMCSVKEGILRNFANFTGEHLCQSLFFNKVAVLRTIASAKAKFYITFNAWITSTQTVRFPVDTHDISRQRINVETTSCFYEIFQAVNSTRLQCLLNSTRCLRISIISLNLRFSVIKMALFQEDLVHRWKKVVATQVLEVF